MLYPQNILGSVASVSFATFLYRKNLVFNSVKSPEELLQPASDPTLSSHWLKLAVTRAANQAEPSL